MRFMETRLSNVLLFIPEPVMDARGYFARTFCEREFAQKGLDIHFVQHSISVSKLKGTVRGMHFQREPHGEVKVVSCRQGSIHDVILDLRPGSPTYLMWQAFELSAQNRHHLYVPKGCAHGFQTLTDNAEVAYLISAFYEPSASTGVRYNDPAFGITWPLPPVEVSEKDKTWPEFTSDVTKPE